MVLLLRCGQVYKLSSRFVKVKSRGQRIDCLEQHAKKIDKQKTTDSGSGVAHKGESTSKGVSEVSPGVSSHEPENESGGTSKVSSHHGELQHYSSNIDKARDIAEKPKKVSKLQQLAKDKAAARKRTIADAAPIDSRDILAPIDESKLKNVPVRAAVALDHPENHNATRASLNKDDILNGTDNRLLKDIKNDEMAKCPGNSFGNDDSFQSVILSKPSEFAVTVIGSLGQTSETSVTNFTDRGFSYLLAATAKSSQPITSQFSKPSPDDIVSKAQATSKGEYLIMTRGQNSRA